MEVYDSLGIVGPFTFQAKVYLREIWTAELDWDEVMNKNLERRWLTFLSQMQNSSELKYDKCLRPLDAEGKPSLILFSDGSDKAFGAVAYARWELRDGSYWSKLIMANHKLRPPEFNVNNP